jgi:two-component system OmpR family response regulator
MEPHSSCVTYVVITVQPACFSRPALREVAPSRKLLSLIDLGNLDTIVHPERGLCQSSMRLLLVEDDAKTASFVLKGLKESGYAVDHVSDGETGLHMAISEPYDAAIIDVMLPKVDGLTLIGELRRKRNKLPVIILSARGSTGDRVKGLETGSDDYLTKPFAFSELLARVQALLRRASGVSEPTSLTVGDLSINLLTRQVARGQNKIDLQPREFALLEYLMRNAGRVVSKTMIMEHVWDYNFDPHTNVVEACVCRLRDKIDKGFGTAKLVHTIRGMGYVIRQAP